MQDPSKSVSAPTSSPLFSFPPISSSQSVFTNTKQAFWYPLAALKFLVQPSHRSILYFTLVQSFLLFLILIIIGSLSFYATYFVLHYVVFTPQRIPNNQWIRLWNFIPINLYWTYTLIWFFICCFTTVICWLIALIPIRALIDSESKKVSEYVEHILLPTPQQEQEDVTAKNVELVVHHIKGLSMESMIENVTKQLVPKHQGNIFHRMLNYVLELYVSSFFHSIFKFVRRYTMRIGFYFIVNALGTVGYLIPFFHVFQFFLQLFILCSTTLLQIALLVFDIIFDRKQYSFIQEYLFVLKHFMILQSYALGLLLMVIVFPPILLCIYPVAVVSATALFLQIQNKKAFVREEQQQSNLIRIVQETFIQPILKLFTREKRND